MGFAEHKPIPTYSVAGRPCRTLNGGSALPTSAPTSGTLENKPAIAEAHGRVGGRGSVTIEVSGACVLTVYCYSPASKNWRLPSSASSGYQKTFGAAGWDYFQMEPGTLFFIKSDTGSISGWTDAPAANS